MFRPPHPYKNKLFSRPPPSSVVKDGQAIKDGVRQRVNKWRHELAPSYRSSSLASCPSSSSSCPPASTSSKASTAKATGSGAGGSSSNSSGRASGGADVLPFLIPLARLARQLEIDAASYATRYETSREKVRTRRARVRIGENCGDRSIIVLYCIATPQACNHAKVSTSTDAFHRPCSCPSRIVCSDEKSFASIKATLSCCGFAMGVIDFRLSGSRQRG